MTLANQLKHAWKGARKEVAAQRGLLKAVRAVRLLLLVIRELIGTARLAPYGARAFLCRQQLVASKRLITLRYGTRTRNCVDVVSPPPEKSQTDLRPVAVFINGGVWSAGDAWQFAPLASRLSDAGALVFVATYTLYPAAVVPTMVDEVCAAVQFAKQTARSLGGDPERITLLGHSAGAHLALSAVLKATSPVHCFVGMAGVYDVAAHYQFESWRGVQNLSTMEAAMGGATHFEALSPALQLTPSMASKLPPMIMLSSRADKTVPSSQSALLAEAASALGVDVTHVIYDSITHVDFATAWEPTRHRGRRDRPQLAETRHEVMAHVDDAITVVCTTSSAQLRTLIQQHRASKMPPAVRIPTVPARSLLR